MPSSSYTSLPLSGKLLDNTKIPPGFQTLRGLNNVVTEAVAFGADELPATAEGSLTVCSSRRYCKSVQSELIKRREIVLVITPPRNRIEAFYIAL